MFTFTSQIPLHLFLHLLFPFHLQARYTDPRTHLQYYSMAEYKMIRGLSRADLAEMLRLRGSSSQHVQMLSL